MRIKPVIQLTIAAFAFTSFFITIARADDIKPVFEKNCASCHGKDGKGETRMGRKAGVKDYTDAKVQSDLTDDKAVKTIKEGLKDDSGKERMKPYGEILSEEQIKNLVAYIRGFKK